MKNFVIKDGVSHYEFVPVRLLPFRLLLKKHTINELLSVQNNNTIIQYLDISVCGHSLT